MTGLLIAPFGGVRFFVPIAIIALFSLVAGTGPACLSTLAITLGISVLFEPIGQFGTKDTIVIHQIAGFALVGLLVSAIGGAERGSRRRRAYHAEQAARQADALRVSQERFRLVSLATHDVVRDFDLTSGQVVWTEALETVLGYPLAEVPRSQSWWAERIHPDDRKPVIDSLEAALGAADVHTWQHEYRFRSRRGDWLNVLDRGHVTRDERGRPLRMIGSMLDLTAQKRAEDALRESESRYRALFENLPDGAFLTRPDGKILAANPAAQEMFGMTEEELIRAGRAGLVETSAPEFRAALEERERRGRYANVELLHIRKGGERFATETSSVVLPEGPLKAFVIVREITERKRAEQAARQSEEQFRQLADAMPQLVWMTKPDGYHEYFNRHWYEYTGTTLETSHGELWAKVLHPDDYERTLKRWRHSLATGVDYEIEYRFRRASDGAYRWFLGRALPVRDSEGRIVRWFGTCTDIDDRKRVEAELALEKARLDVILKSLPVGVFIADASGRVLEVNERCRAIWAMRGPIEQNYGQYVGYRPGTRERYRAEDWALARALYKGETIVSEVIDIVRFDGTPGTVLNHAAPFRDPQGNITGAVVVVHDITDLKKAQDALRDSEARAREQYADLEQIYRQAPVGLFTFDRDCRFMRINEVMADINGLAVEEHIGKRMEEVVPNVAPFLREMYRPVFDRGEPVLDLPIHGETPSRPGVCRDWIGNYYPWRSKTGEVIGLTAAVIEVTELRRTERARRESQHQLEQVNGRLEEADRRKDQFLAMLSHELRNPLAPIKSSLFILDRAAPGSEQAKRAEHVIDRQVGHMTRLIDDLLDVTRISRGKIRLQRERIDLAEVVRRTADDHRSVFKTAEVGFRVEVPAGRVFVQGDPTRLAQAVGNLLGNAVKFTPRGGQVELRLLPENGAAAIHVRDDGAGIAPDLLSQLFRPFVQADTTLDRSKGGLGLGLALVKSLIELHGGSVAGCSDGSGKGAEFVLRLPLDREEARAFQDAGPSAGVDRHRLRVLVIEDNVDAAESLKEALELNGHQVETEGTGAAGIAKARSFHPDVVLCDIGLPEMDGFEVARQMRSDPDLRTAPLVALSGYAAPEDLERSKEAGFDRHLAKPPDLGVLESTIAQVSAQAHGAVPAHA
ncbi:MAG: PAS domain S-box protein [Myxococcales bacterium]